MLCIRRGRGKVALDILQETINGEETDDKKDIEREYQRRRRFRGRQGEKRGKGLTERNLEADGQLKDRRYKTQNTKIKTDK